MSSIATHITFRGLPTSEALDSDIRERIAWLEQFYGGIVRCRVLVELPHRHAERGRRFHVRIELSVGAGAPPIVVSYDRSSRAVDEAEAERSKAVETGAELRDAQVAVHDAFDAARRQLEDYARQQRHTHHDPHHGQRPGGRTVREAEE